MPLINSKDSNGSYYKFGDNGKKYYYITNNKTSRTIARNKALRQGRAIEVSKHSK